MERSSSRFWPWLDRAALGGMALGIALTLAPGCFAAGFFVTAFFTVLHIVTSHAC